MNSLKKDALPKSISKLKNPKRKNILWFTLVELIVVITILTILGTIGFVQIQGFSASARDSVRIENLANLQKWLTLFQVKTGSYPQPEGSLNILASGAIIWYQGFAKDQILWLVGVSVGATKDPSDATIYTTYLMNINGTRMQVMNFLEDGTKITAFENQNFGIIPAGFAASTSDYSQRTPTTKGDNIGILISTSTGNLNQPLQENISVSFTGIDLVTYTGTLSDGKTMTLKAQIADTEKMSGTGGELMAVESNLNQKMRLVMFACPTVAGWTDLGSTPQVPSAQSVSSTNDNITFTWSRICESANNDAIPTWSIFLTQSWTCNSSSLVDTGWTTPLAPSAWSAYCDVMGTSPCSMCKGITKNSIRTWTIVLMQACPFSWNDLGNPPLAPSAKSAWCLYWKSCRICQKQ